jgi:hypothetical protein
MTAHMTRDHRFVVDSAGHRAAQRDRRVVHVLPYRTNDFLVRMLAPAFERRGLAFRAGEPVTPETLQRARSVCSGRECLAFQSLVAATHRDLATQRPAGEISIYHGLEADGPCQCGAWPLVWEVFARRLEARDAVFPGHPTVKNDYLGHGLGFGAELVAVMAAADVLDEARRALPCVAQEPAGALAAFDAEADAVVESARGGVAAVALALHRFSRRVARIPRRARLTEVPSVLVFGGGELPVLYRPVVEFLAEQGVAVKLVDLSDFMLYLEADWMLRFAFRMGRRTVAGQFAWSRTLALALVPGELGRAARRALRSKLATDGGDLIVRVFKRVARESGLVHDGPVALRELVERGDAHIPHSLHCDAITSAGRFERSVERGTYDAYVHLASVNCRPALQIQGSIRKLASDRDVTLATIDLAVPKLTPQQLRVLENVVIQAKRAKARAA